MLRLFLLISESFILILGMTLPLLGVNQFWIFKENQSLLDILLIFYKTNEFFLLILVSTMGFALPILKVCLRFANYDGVLIRYISRFSCIDIFLIAILVFVSKSSTFIKVELLEGFYFLCVGVLLGLLQLEKYIKYQSYSDNNNTIL